MAGSPSSLGDEVNAILRELILRGAGEASGEYRRAKELVEESWLELQLLEDRRQAIERDLAKTASSANHNELRSVEAETVCVERKIMKIMSDIKDEGQREAQLRSNLVQTREACAQTRAELAAQEQAVKHDGEHQRDQLRIVSREYGEQAARLEALKEKLTERKKQREALQRQSQRLEDDMRRLIYQHET